VDKEGEVSFEVVLWALGSGIPKVDKNCSSHLKIVFL
jgi:hypothetical protein